ncbi:hypothetical protein ABKA04_000815 [Annulohypoxylon sp. FPYF3050]
MNDTDDSDDEFNTLIDEMIVKCDSSNESDGLDDEITKSHDVSGSPQRLQIYSRYHWITHVQTQEGHNVDYQLADLLKQFLGSFEESSVHYRRWHDQLTNLARKAPPTSIFSQEQDNFVVISEIPTTILAACRFSLYSLLKDWWFSAEIPPQTDDDDDNPLISATLAGSKPILEILVSRGMSVDTWSDMHGTALALAAYRNDLEVVNFLVQKGADINLSFSAYRDYTCALAVAIGEGNLDIVRFLVQEGADINMPMWYTSFSSALKIAIHMGKRQSNPDIVKFLVQKGAHMSSCYKDDNALTEAMSINFDDIIQFLIDGDVMKPDDYMNAFKKAMTYGRTEIIKLLVQKGKVDVNTVYHGETALSSALIEDNIEVVKFLVKEANADVNIPLDRHGYGNALSMAAHKGKLAVVKLLVLEGRADVNMLIESGIFGSALTAAAACLNNVETIDFLVQEGKADVNARLETGRYSSALAAAAYRGYKDNVEALLDYGADVNLSLSVGPYSTILQVAGAGIFEGDGLGQWRDMDYRVAEREQDKAEVIEMLVRHGAR